MCVASSRCLAAKGEKLKRALILSGGGGRGAFQVGVWRYLQERGWDPDLVCGTSVGAINAAALCSEMPLEKLMHIWTTLGRGRVYRPAVLDGLRRFCGGRPFRSLADTTPLRRMLGRYLDVAALRSGPREIYITAIDIVTSQLVLFDRETIGVDQVMASSAIPGLFPWQVIDGTPFWDGGMMANTPLFPALERGVQEAVVVLLSPVGHAPLVPPTTPARVAELALEHLLAGSYQCGRRRPPAGTPAPRIHTVAPPAMLGFRSWVNFSGRHAVRLMRMGYHSAREQLADLDPGSGN
jgi:NTE family protein